MYKDLINKEKKFEAAGYPYPGNGEWLREVLNRLISIGEEIGRWDPKDLFINAENPPIPEPKLRVTPEF